MLPRRRDSGQEETPSDTASTTNTSQLRRRWELDEDEAPTEPKRRAPVSTDPRSMLPTNPRAALPAHPRAAPSDDPRATLPTHPRAALPAHPRAAPSDDLRATLPTHPRAALSADPRAPFPADPPAREPGFVEDEPEDGVPTPRPRMPLTAVPLRVVSDRDLLALPLDHRAGFVLSHIDGLTDMRTLIDVCGMTHNEIVEVVDQLLALRAIRLV